MQNKRGQGLEVSTLILIVLGVIILVLLVLGFSMGWGNLWEKVNIFQGGSSIESVIQGCKVAVSSASTYSYCQDFKKVKVDGKDAYLNCEDSRVSGNLGGSTLTCTNGKALIESKCSSLVDNAPVSKDKIIDCSALAKVNGEDCSKFSDSLIARCNSVPITTCNQFPVDEKNKANECLKDKCLADNILSSAVTSKFNPALAADKVCCKTACITP